MCSGLSGPSHGGDPARRVLGWCDPAPVQTQVAGLLLAAGAGRRIGGPKALVTGDDGRPWVVSSTRRLLAAGCTPVRVVLGAGAGAALEALEGAGQPALPSATVDVVVAPDWDEGMGASLRAGLDGLELLAPAATAALVHLVDLPDVGTDVLKRLVARAEDARGPEPDSVLARATYAGVVGHPVLLGRAHWAAIAGAASGDRGARDYLAERDVEPVEAGDLATGRDVDRPPPSGTTGRGRADDAEC